jgi:hypothetical protein
VLDRLHLAIADDHVRLAAQDRPDQLGDVATLVLVVSVGVDDHVGPQLEAGVKPGLECGREALVVGQPDHVIDPVSPSDLDRAVLGAVVDEQPFDRLEPLHMTWQVIECFGKLVFLVETGDLNDQLHSLN